MKRDTHDDVIGGRVGSGTGDLEGTLFDTPTKPNWAETYTPAQRSRDIQRLIPLARELAQRAGAHGITVSNLRFAAAHRGLITGEEKGRRLSFLGSVFKAAGLVNTGEYRRSDVARSHGNIHCVFVATEFRKGAA